MQTNIYAKMIQSYISRGMTEGKYPPYKASGIAYIQFAKEEKELKILEKINFRGVFLFIL